MLYKIVAISIEEQLALSQAEEIAHRIYLDQLSSQAYRVRVEKLAVPENGRLYRFPFTYVNPVQVETVGLFRSAEEMIDKTDFDCFEYESALSAYNDYVKIVEAVQKAIKNKIKIVETDLGIHKEETLKDKLGRTHVFRVHKVPVIENGLVVTINGNSVDITRERELETKEKELASALQIKTAAYEQSFMLSPTCMSLIDTNNIILNANKMFHIANEYCIAIPGLTFTNDEISKIHNSFGAHFSRYKESNTGTLYITQLFNKDDPNLDFLQQSTNEKIQQALKEIREEKYQLIARDVDILNLHIGTPEEKEFWRNRSKANSPYKQNVEHKCLSGKIKIFESLTQQMILDGKEVYEGVDYDVTEAELLKQNIVEKNNELIQANALLEQKAQELNSANALLEEQKKELEKLALFDTLTGLATRRLFMASSISALEGAKRHNTPPEYVGFIFIDLNQLKSINDIYGHDSGDEAIKCLAKELKNATRATDVCARYGGDEFVILCTGIKNSKEIHIIETRFKQAIDKITCKINDNLTLSISGSIGSSIYTYLGQEEKDPRKTNDILTSLLKEADEKMYADKKARKKREQKEDTISQ